MVLQKNTLFSGSLIDNLRWGNENATLDEIKEACQIACVDEFVDRLADGYDTEMGQEGVNVSGGQKQTDLHCQSHFEKAESTDLR